METMFEDDISILTQEALGPSEVWLDGPGDPSMGGDMGSASHFALITAYGDIKERLGGLERENATLRRRLKVYEIKVRIVGGRDWGSATIQGSRGGNGAAALEAESEPSSHSGETAFGAVDSARGQEDSRGLGRWEMDMGGELAPAFLRTRPSSVPSCSTR